MVMVTLVGETQARIGNRFYFLGPLTDCKECRLKTVCFNLEPGSMYEVTRLRDTVHECQEHEGNVRVVEVEKVPTQVCVPKKLAIDGSKITFQSIQCGRLDCEYWGKCHPTGIKDGQKLMVTDIIENAECPAGEDLVLVKLI